LGVAKGEGRKAKGTAVKLGFHNFAAGAAKVCAFQFRFEALGNLEQTHGEPVLPTEVPEFMGEFGFVAQVVDAVLVDLVVNGVHAGLLLRQDFTDIRLRLEVAGERAYEYVLGER
jgi:hypothetical protein